MRLHGSRKKSETDERNIQSSTSTNRQIEDILITIERLNKCKLKGFNILKEKCPE